MFSVLYLDMLRKGEVVVSGGTIHTDGVGVD